LLELANVLKKHPHVLILSDDIYNKLVFDQDEVAPHILNVAPELASRTIIINGASKSYSMTGWRVGWALGPLDVIKAMTSYQSQSVSCTPGFCQKAALTAIKESATELRESNEILVDRRDTAVELINKIRGLKVKAPGGAFYLWVDVNSYLGKRFNGAAVSNSKDFCKYLLEDQKVAVVPGAEFGQEGYMRISYAIDKPRMAEAIGRIQTFVQKID
jgi:aspartate aminotransferase